VSGEGFKAFRRPITDLLFGCTRGVNFGHRAFPKERPAEVDQTAELGRHRFQEDLILAYTQSLSGLKNDVNMARWLRVDEFIRQFLSHGGHKIAVLAEESYMLVVRGAF
jgi:hypothetical protein